jgi:hypothetical protein
MSGPIDLPTGAFLGKSIPAAIKLYLMAARKKKTARDIAAALKEGGVESTAANFENMITGSLHRMRGFGDVLKFPDGWTLAEFYPESMRARLTKDAPPKKRKARAKKAAKAAPEAAKPRRAIDLRPGPLMIEEKAG